MTDRVDFHSHFLPCADHGSDGVETSAAQLKLLSSAGVRYAVATPHFYPQRTNIARFLEKRARCAEALSHLLREDSPAVYLGAEVLICAGMEELKDLPKLCIAGTDVLLLEMPFRAFDDRLLETVDRIAKRGDVRPVMAHIDRYGVEDVKALMELDVKAQVNATALCSFFTRKHLSRYFSEDRVWALASDLHMADEKTISQYQKGLSKLGEEKEKAVNDRARSLIDGAQPLKPA